MNQIFGDNNKNRFNNNGAYNPYNNMYSNSAQGRNNFYANQNYQPNNYTNVSKANYNKVDLKRIVRFFCVIIFIFGICVIGKSVFGFTVGREKVKDNIQVSVEQFGKEVIVTVDSEKPIKQFKYGWKGEQYSVIEGNNEDVEIKKTIQIPLGNNLLDMIVTDFYGNERDYQKQYFFESDDDEKPNIELSSVGKDILITATDNKKIQYITYRWNDENEVKITADEGAKKLEQKIEVKHGQNILTVEAFDSTGNRQKKEEKIIGDEKPDVSLSIQDNNIVVNAKDDEGIKKISVNVDGVITDSGDESLNEKDVTAKLEITPGNHKIVVTVTNINNLEAVKELSASN